MQTDFDRIHEKLDKIETKLDAHLERISSAEASIEWIRGHITIGITIIIPAFLATVGWLAVEYLQGLGK